MNNNSKIIGLNIGAGKSFSVENWENLDYLGNVYGKDDYIPHINFDLNSLKKIPRNDKTYDCIYSSHTVEHLLNEAVAHMFNESFRLLKDNGIIRISCPDYDKMLHAYLSNYNVAPSAGDRYGERWSAFDSFLFKSFTFCHRRGRGDHYINKFKDSKDSDMYRGLDFDNDIITKEKFDKLLKEGGKNYTFDYCYNISKKYNLKYADLFSGNHVNWWNKEKLTKYLKQAGFSDIKVYPRNKLSYTNLMIGPNFGDSMPGWSIFIEAKKNSS